MPTKAKRRRAEDDHRYWEATIREWSLSFQFGYKVEDHWHDAGFDDLWHLELECNITSPIKWRGVKLVADIYGERGLQLALDAASFSSGPPTTRSNWRYDESDRTDVGYIHPVLKTRIPKEVRLYAKVPLDLFLELNRTLESGRIRALSASTFRKEGADPKAAWVRSLGFMAQVETSAGPDP